MSNAKDKNAYYSRAIGALKASSYLVGGMDYGIVGYRRRLPAIAWLDYIFTIQTERMKRRMKNLLADLASQFLTDETLLAILVRRGYPRIDVRKIDGSYAYKINMIGAKQVKDKMVTGL